MKSKINILIRIYITWLIFFYGIQFLLSKFHMEYRLWLSILGLSISVIAFFILVGIILGTVIKNIGLKVLALSSYSLASVAILFLMGVYSLLTIHQEHQMEDGSLKVSYGECEYAYEKVSFWGRRQIWGIEEKRMLEEKYGCRFTIDSSALVIGRIWYVSGIYPDIKVTANLSNGMLQDDYKEQYINKIFGEIYDELDLTSRLSAQTFAGSNFYHACLKTGIDDIDNLANESAALIKHTLSWLKSDMAAPCSDGILYVVIYFPDNYYVSITLPFGTADELLLEGKSEDYYTYQENVTDKINQAIADYETTVIE